MSEIRVHLSGSNTNQQVLSMNKSPAFVAVDDGYAQTKLYGDGPDGKPVKLAIRTSVRAGRYGLGSISGEAVIGSYDTEEGDQFTISDDIAAENTQFDSFHTSSMNRALVNHVLIQGGYSGRDVKLIAGLPVADFFLADGKDEEKIAAKTANLLKKVTSVSANAPVANLRDVRIGCQAVAAFVDHVLDDDLKETADMDATIAVVDIGGRTTDIAVVVRGNSIDHEKSGTTNIGVLDVYKALSKEIRAKFKTRDEFPLSQMDQAVRTGKIRLWNEENDVSAEVASIVREHETRIAREVERRLGSASNISGVLFVGGGSALFKGISARFRNGIMHDDPEFANARGLHKYGRYMAVDTAQAAE